MAGPAYNLCVVHLLWLLCWMKVYPPMDDMSLIRPTTQDEVTLCDEVVEIHH